MGIPKFYRWISERYPCLSEKIREYQIPEFDNLYLDMNGIIHNCSHPNDEDIHLRIPEKTIFRDIFRYIDFLFKMIKPRRTFFMAVDGVAPRAKMNQQRGRRFRSAKLAEEQEEEALRKGEKLPTESRFDSNCITPGTEFMARLHLQLQYFVKVKVSTDPLWQRPGLKVYLSGHDVPGEGEHKIMDFIRYIRSDPNYDAETRHCLYGLDADLIMLGLSTHEPHFSLLREQVKFTVNRKPKKPRPSFKRSASPSKKLPPLLYTVDSNKTISEGKSFSDALKSLENDSSDEKNKDNCAKNVEIFDKNEKKETEVGLADDEGAKGSFKAPIPEKTTFLLLHLSLMRDYIDEEFSGLKKALENHPTITYDIERLIDDWILISILIGNDFIPHLPMLHIVKGAFPMLYQKYAQLLPSLDGYINENGRLHLGRFQTFLRSLSSFDLEIFLETYDDMKYMESKTGRPITLGDSMFKNYGGKGHGNLVGEIGEVIEDEIGMEDDEFETSPELQALLDRTNAEVFGEIPCSSANLSPGHLVSEAFENQDFLFEQEDSAELRLEFLQYKRNYYVEKMRMKEVTRDAIREIAQEYVRAIQWILLYYYKGVSSWGWYYPSHYAPFCSDICNISTFNMEFDMGEPFKPFEQLLGVLPSLSGKLLPKCFHDLMTSSESPILDFYPKEFENDLNGKRSDWEAVVLIPFIDEKRLLEAMREAALLNSEEEHRNDRGSLHAYSYIESDSGPVVSHGDTFPSLPNSHVVDQLVYEVKYDPKLLPCGVHPKAKQDKIYQGFPTLKTIPHKSKLDRAEIKVFEFVTREESLILELLPREPVKKFEKIGGELLGKTVWVNWPHLTYALVTGLSNDKMKIVLDYSRDKRNPTIRSDGAFDPRNHSVAVRNLKERHMKFKGIHLENVSYVIWAKTMEGRRMKFDSSGKVIVDTQWSTIEQPYALETTIYSEDVTEIFYLDRQQHTSFHDVFNIGERVFKIDSPHYGAIGKVIGRHRERVEVEFMDLREGDGRNLADEIGRSILKSREYYTGSDAAYELNLQPFTIAKITGTIFVTMDREVRKKSSRRKKPFKNGKNRPNLVDKIEGDSGSSDEEEVVRKEWKENIGLNLKFNKKNLEVRGYTRKEENQWLYSQKAIELIRDYCTAFPDIVQFLKSTSTECRDSYAASTIFPSGGNARVSEVIEWIDKKGIAGLAKVPTNSNVLDDEDVGIVGEFIRSKKSIKKGERKVLTLSPNSLYKPGLSRGCVAPDGKSSHFYLLDRIVSVDPSGPLPIGSTGTLVGILPPADAAAQEEEAFRSTSATVLPTLVVLPDPIIDPFDKKNENLNKGDDGEGKDELSSMLCNLLNIGAGNKSIFGGFNPQKERKSPILAKNSGKNGLLDHKDNEKSEFLSIKLTEDGNKADKNGKNEKIGQIEQNVVKNLNKNENLVIMYPFQVLNLSYPPQPKNIFKKESESSTLLSNFSKLANKELIQNEPRNSAYGNSVKNNGENRQFKILKRDEERESSSKFSKNDNMSGNFNNLSKNSGGNTKNPASEGEDFFNFSKYSSLVFENSGKNSSKSGGAMGGNFINFVKGDSLSSYEPKILKKDEKTSKNEPKIEAKVEKSGNFSIKVAKKEAEKSSSSGISVPSSAFDKILNKSNQEAKVVEKTDKNERGQSLNVMQNGIFSQILGKEAQVENDGKVKNEKAQSLYTSEFFTKILNKNGGGESSQNLKKDEIVQSPNNLMNAPQISQNIFKKPQASQNQVYQNSFQNQQQSQNFAINQQKTPNISQKFEILPNVYLNAQTSSNFSINQENGPIFYPNQQTSQNFSQNGQKIIQNPFKKHESISAAILKSKIETILKKDENSSQNNSKINEEKAVDEKPKKNMLLETLLSNCESEEKFEIVQKIETKRSSRIAANFGQAPQNPFFKN